MTTLTAVFLCLAVLVLSPATGQRSGIVSSCCLTTSNTKIRMAQISSYFRQNTGRCPVEALVFTSVTGRKICSDPSDPWAKKAKAVVDARRKSSTTVTVSSQKTPDTTSSLRKTTPSTPNATEVEFYCFNDEHGFFDAEYKRQTSGLTFTLPFLQ